jgi:hypothetical protein
LPRPEWAATVNGFLVTTFFLLCEGPLNDLDFWIFRRADLLIILVLNILFIVSWRRKQVDVHAESRLRQDCIVHNNRTAFD